MTDRTVALRQPLLGPGGPITSVTIRMPAADERDRQIDGVTASDANIAAITGIPTELACQLGEADRFAIAVEWVGLLSAQRQTARYLGGMPWGSKTLRRTVMLEAPIGSIRRFNVLLGAGSVGAATRLEPDQIARLGDADFNEIAAAMCAAPGEEW